MRTYNRRVFCLAVLWIVLCLCPGCCASDGCVIVSLGDSLARGYGLSEPEQERYGARIAETLAGMEINLGVDGLRAEELLERIDLDYARPLAEADLVLVSIGANHVLGAMARYWYGGSLRDAMASVEAEMVSFEETLQKIGTSLRKAAPNATILYVVFFNPWSTCEADLVREAGDKLVEQLNSVIRARAEADGALIAEPNAAVASVWTRFPYGESMPDPHPDAAAHAAIAQTILEQLS